MTTSREQRTFPDGILSQHAHLARGVADLRKAQADGAAWSELASRLDDLVEGVRMHFASEEAEMQHNGYPKVAEHRLLHATFLRRLIVLRAECDARRTELMASFVKTLESWLKNHERTADRDVLEFLGLVLPSPSPLRARKPPDV
jgi:hemerythrin